MGRKPNALFTHFFARGPKVADASNRYSHTCKLCGEFFAKGRQESLLAHLLRACVNISGDDRKWVAIQMQDMASLRDIALNPARANPHREYSSLADLTALETLAEVSRQQLDPPPLPPQQEQQDQHQDQHHDQHQDLTDPDPQQGRNKRPRLDGQSDESLAFEENLIRNLRAKLHEQVDVDPSLDSDSPQHTAAQDDATAAAATASAASDMLQTALLDPFADVDLPQLELNHQPAPPPPQQPQAPAKPTQRIYPANPAHPHAGTRTDFKLTLPTQTPSSSTRGRFTHARREEVRTLRSLGACLRCRMLKKPCSPSAPCTPCARVAAARLWTRSTCVRTKLPDALDVFNSGLHQALAQQRVAAASRRGAFEPLARTAQVALRADVLPMLLPLARLRTRDDGAERAPANMFTAEHAEVVEMLDLDAKKLQPLLAAHLDNLLSPTIADEPDTWTRQTLRLASTLNTARPSRLAADTLTLWCSTAHLTAPTPPAHLLRDRPPEHHALLDARAALYSRERDAGYAASAELVSAQLGAALDTHARTLSRRIGGAVEARLQHKHKTAAERLELGVACAVLFCACARLAAYYASWDARRVARAGVELEEAPAGRVARIEHAVELVGMLLQVRRVAFGPRRDLEADREGDSVNDACARLQQLVDGLCESSDWTDDAELLDKVTAAWADLWQLQVSGDSAVAAGAGSSNNITWLHKFAARLFNSEP